MVDRNSIQLDGRMVVNVELLLDGMALQIKNRDDGSYSILFPSGLTIELVSDPAFGRPVVIATPHRYKIKSVDI